MKNWFTTILGSLAALGQVFAAGTTGTLHDIAVYVGAAALAIFGAGSKDASNKN